ncbi:immunoglobulin-like domain-containing protein [Alkalibacillus haloalkaliphilus]|uniref:immunoglobulin-like domain-containing protein n=1 Tax=Alkalibacillus haloalkaliphilus TaxID=94136 RepID=UPI0002F121F8|nr:immunoglobulin-like domain-containing protein [Alkalibacillus haloalkaliphilus]
MKRFLFSIFFIIISLPLLSACYSNQTAEKEDWELTEYEAVNTLDGVTMNVKEETLSSTGFTVTLENNSDKQYIYSEDFMLERKIDGQWYQVPLVPGASYGFGEPAHELHSSDVSDWSVDWEWLYGSLDTGEYRIVKRITNYEENHLAAEFTID